MRDKPGLPYLLPPITTKEKERHKETGTKHKANKRTRSTPPGPLFLHLLRAGLDLDATSTSPSSPPSWATGVSSLGTSGALTPRFLRGGGGDLHPLASLLAAQASARAPWNPPQFARLAVGRPTRALAPTHSAPLDGASVVGREVVLCAMGAPRGCGQAVGGNALPPAAPAAESVWSPRLLGERDQRSGTKKRAQKAGPKERKSRSKRAGPKERVQRAGPKERAQKRDQEGRSERADSGERVQKSGSRRVGPKGGSRRVGPKSGPKRVGPRVQRAGPKERVQKSGSKSESKRAGPRAGPKERAQKRVQKGEFERVQKSESKKRAQKSGPKRAGPKERVQKSGPKRAGLKYENPA